MTDLQISLIVIGCVIVAGVVGYNKLHEYRARKNVERAFSDEPDDVLMTPAAPPVSPTEPPAQPASDERQEPVFAEHDFVMPTEPSQVVSDSAVPEEENVGTGGKAPAELPVDTRIDCAIPLILESTVSGEKLIPLLQTLRHVGSKPVHFMGLVETSIGKPEGWQPIVYGDTYRELQAGVQLANRSGALNELEYSELVMRLRQIADEIGAEPEIPDMPQVMTIARALRQFVIDHDARLSINIRSNGAPWAIGTLLAALERQGFDVRPDGRFAMLDPDGNPLFVLTTNETVTAEHTSRLTLLLDVPRVGPQQDGFGAMIACAQSLTKRLDGAIVDDSGQALTDEMLQEIAGQVRAFYQDMEQADIPAGSTRALRLFA